MTGNTADAIAGFLRMYRYATPRVGVLFLLYLGVILLPLGLAVWQTPQTDGSFFTEVGKNCALLGLALVFLQFVLAARCRLIERPVGIDILYSFHRFMGVLAGALLLCHPLFLAMGDQGAAFLFTLSQPVVIWLGKIALALLVFIVLLSVFQRILIGFRKWRFVHNVAVVLVLLLGVAHSMFVGGDLAEGGALLGLWLLLMLTALGAYAWHKVIRRWWRRLHAWSVEEVVSVAPDVYRVKLTPPSGREVAAYLPGQAQFLTLLRKRGLPREEHPFTISSSPTEAGCLVSTIKKSGGFTATIGQTRPGDRAIVEAPYGRFSYLMHPATSRLFFIAGGIGVTPLRSMLRYMADIRLDVEVVLLHFVRTSEDLVFRGEFEEIASRKRPRLQYVPVVSRSEEGWRGETGHVDSGLLRKHIGEGGEGQVYLCGPPGMMKASLRALREVGIPRTRIHYEYFSL
ncbi:ferric reductase-like transmembrane domain-containing protein [bacterium]|nr:ferric reductase-like transmembrane domain-containing protein [bacterium]